MRSMEAPVRLARARRRPQVDVSGPGQALEHVPLVRREALSVLSTLALQRFDEAGAVSADLASRRV